VHFANEFLVTDAIGFGPEDGEQWNFVSPSRGVHDRSVDFCKAELETQKKEFEEEDLESTTPEYIADLCASLREGENLITAREESLNSGAHLLSPATVGSGLYRRHQNGGRLDYALVKISDQRNATNSVS
jgi:hypothetical protein